MGGLTGASEALPAAGLLLTLCAWLCKQLLLALTPLLAEPAVVGVVTEEPSVLARVGALDVMAVGAFLVLCRVRLRQDGPAAPVLQSSAAAGARGWHWTRRSTAPSPPPTSAGDASQVVYSPFRGLPKGSALPPPSTVADKLDDTVSVSERTPLPAAGDSLPSAGAPPGPPVSHLSAHSLPSSYPRPTPHLPRADLAVMFLPMHRLGSADPHATVWVRSGLHPAAAARRDPPEPHRCSRQRGRHPVRAGGPRLCRLRYDQGWARGAEGTRLRALPGRAL
eukprot:COSAG04_NODE_1045_length_8578_cov_9.398396_4_plen_279_part_00